MEVCFQRIKVQVKYNSNKIRFQRELLSPKNTRYQTRVHRLYARPRLRGRSPEQISKIAEQRFVATTATMATHENIVDTSATTHTHNMIVLHYMHADTRKVRVTPAAAAAATAAEATT